MKLFDSHCHIDADAFEADRDQVLDRSRAAGVTEMAIIGMAGRESAQPARAAIELARTEPGLCATVGVHPHDAAGNWRAYWDELSEMAAAPEVVAVGESGLDYYYKHSPPEAQAEAFRAHIELARATDKPIVCHIRDAHEDAAAVLKSARPSLPPIIHCFTGDADDARRYLDLGAFISFSGIVTFGAASALRDALATVPRECLLIETDAPYLAPVPVRGGRNEPANLVHTARRIAELLGMELEEVASLTRDNARRAYRMCRSNSVPAGGYGGRDRGFR